MPQTRPAVVLSLLLIVCCALGAQAASEYRGVNMALEMAHAAEIQYLATEWNANLIRICLYMAGEWGYFVPSSDAPTEFPESHWERLDRFLDDCEANGARVLIDLHQWQGYGYLNGVRDTRMWATAAYKDSFVEFWRLMAQRYADRGDVIYGYDLLNEPHAEYGGSILAHRWHTLAQRAIDAIREHDTEHAIVIDCTDWGNPSGFNHLEPLDDDNIIYSFHMWLPHEFTHQGVSNSRSNVGYPSATWNQAWLREQLAPVLAFQAEHDVPILAGEIGATTNAGSVDRAAYFEDCLELFEEYGFDYAQWCYMEWGNWSLEHARNPYLGEGQSSYTGDTRALEVYLDFLSRNVMTAPADSGPRPRCLFDRPGEVRSWEYSVFAGDLLWKLDHAFEVRRNEAEITQEELEGQDLLVLGSLRAHYTSAEIETIDAFVRNGGGLLHHGPEGDNELVDWLASVGLSLQPEFVLSRPHEWDAGSYLCDTIAVHPMTQDVIAFHTNWTAHIALSDGATALVWSPDESWMDGDGDRMNDASEPQGPFVLVAAQELGAGRIAVFADDAFNLTANYAITLGAAMWLIGK